MFQPALSLIRRPRTRGANARDVADEERAERGEGDHEDRDACFRELPEDFPGDVDGVGGGTDGGDLDEAGDDHGDGETEGGADGELLAELDLHVPEHANGDNHYCGMKGGR